MPLGDYKIENGIIISNQKGIHMYNIDKTIRDIAINIYALRKSKNMSAHRLGLKIGKAESTITAWERGERVPSMKDILAICNVFSCSVDEMFKMQVITS